jgi:hypothetical protein
MSLIIPNYPDPQDSATPIAGAVAWIGALGLAFDDPTVRGHVLLHVSRTAASAVAYDPPVASMAMGLGQSFAGGGAFPTFAELMADPAFATAFGTIRAKLYAAAKAAHPALADATDAGD